MNTLQVKARQGADIILDGGEAGNVFLKASPWSDNHRPGDQLEVFVYVDRELRLAAAATRPRAMVGEFSFLRVVTVTPAGAFMDWGLESDLLVPRSEQQVPMHEGRSYVVYVFLDRSNNRAVASSKLKKFLSTQEISCREQEEVDLIIFAKTDLGYSAVVNQSHAGVIYHNEIFQKLFIGQRLPGYIKKIRDDGRIDLQLQKPGGQTVDDIAQKILETLKSSRGTMAITDSSTPEVIHLAFGVSKKVFKKALGALYKKKLITIGTDSIHLTD